MFIVPPKVQLFSTGYLKPLKLTTFQNKFTDWQHSSGHQDVDGAGRDVAADDLDDADNDGDADN